MLFAAIDLGTNSFHLVIADTKPNGTFRVVAGEKEMVRLGESGSDMKRLSPDAMERGFMALRRFKTIIDSRGVKSVRAVATSAIREAENQREFLQRVRLELGINIEVVSGVEEGRLIYLGVIQALPLYDKRTLVIDIGGGSTEYVVGGRASVKYIASLKLGAIRISKRFKLTNKPNESDIDSARHCIVGELTSPARQIQKKGFDTVAISSGTAQTIAAMVYAKRYPEDILIPERLNNFTFTYDEVKSVTKELLASSSLSTRKKIAGLDERRADIILGGALILYESLRLLKVKKVTVSSYALREGVIYDHLHSRRPSSVRRHDKLRDVREQSVRHLGEICKYDEGHAQHVAKLACSIFDQTVELHELTDAEKEYLYYAALLHDIGYHISHSEHHKHSEYIISNADLLGFTNEEIQMIACIARYHRKSHPKPKHLGFGGLQTDEHREIVQKLAAILRLAESFDRGNIGIIKSVEVKVGGRTAQFGLKRQRNASRDLELEIWGAERKKMLFQEVYAREVQFHEL